MRQFKDSDYWRPRAGHYPLPKGNSIYAQAKKAEYLEKNIPKAKSLYEEAIKIGDRPESAVKDLASLLHQEGRTQEACDLLQEHKHIFTDQQRFQNLLENLREKLVPSGNCLFKKLKLYPVRENDSPDTIRRLFRDATRILNVQIDRENACAFLCFSSHSAARKTLSSFCKWRGVKIEWVNQDGDTKNNSPDMKTAVLLLGKDLTSEIFFDKGRINKCI